VTQRDEVREMVKETLAKFGKLDILVNNAGVAYVGEGKMVIRKLFLESTEEDWPREINVTLYGTLNCTKAAIEPMIKQKSGNIVNIVSDAGRNHSPHASIYGAGKGGIIALSRNLAYELGPLGIRVNCVSPGVIKTTRIESVESGAMKDPEGIKNVRELETAVKLTTPARRIGLPQDVANAVAFLASDVSSYIVGQTLSVNGGRLMP
jgi:NAD(P)-dependent dehydrogenase (short-subunit alcohol dehydrogenase family)